MLQLWQIVKSDSLTLVATLATHLSTFSPQRDVGRNAFLRFSTQAIVDSFLAFFAFQIMSDSGQIFIHSAANKSECSQPQAGKSLPLHCQNCRNFPPPKISPFSLKAKIPIFNSLGKVGVDLRNLGDLSTIAAVTVATVAPFSFESLKICSIHSASNSSRKISIILRFIFSLLDSLSIVRYQC